MKTFADELAEVLANGGVRRISGIVADSVYGLTDANSNRSKIEWIYAHLARATADRGGLVDAAEFLSNLAGALKPSYLHQMQIDLVVSADTLPLETERCWLLGLIVKELITNAVRRACVLGAREKKINIELTWEDSLVHCAVADNGPGMASARLLPGLRTAHYLAATLGGRIGHWFDDEGSSFVATFPFTEREFQENETFASRQCP